MKLDEVRPAHCYARARRVLAETVAIRDELGRSEDGRTPPEVTNAQPRECYFEAMAAWRKARRLADELGVPGGAVAMATPDLRDLKPGHVLSVLDAVMSVVDGIHVRLGLTQRAAEPAIEDSRQPSDVLRTIVQINRELSRALERPFTPTDVFTMVALASTYASRLGGNVDRAGFIRARKPSDCYARLESCLAKATALVAKQGNAAMAVKGTPEAITPSDVYDLACMVAGELAFLHAVSTKAQPVYAFEVSPSGHVLPSHVDQLARTLDAQLSAIG